MKTIALVVLTIAVLFAGALAVAHLSSSHSEAAAPFQKVNITYENDTNRRGSDYRDFDIQADPNACRTACWNDATCRAYTYVNDDSSICTAAVHSGVITLASGGTVTIEIRAGQQGYRGSTQYGVTSSNYGGWPGSFGFVR